MVKLFMETGLTTQSAFRFRRLTESKGVSGTLITTIQRDEVLKQIGYKNPPERNLLHLMDQMLELADTCLDPVMRFKEINGSGDLPLFLRGSSLSYTALATIGPRLEGRAKEFFDSGRAVEGYLLDTIGSVAVMRVGNALWAEIVEDAALRGVAQGLRRAPGCRGVPMEVQKWIVETFHDPALGIRVTSSCMLFPRKSFAFLGRFGGKLETAFPCKGCPQQLNCDLRS
jgi:hypothetical protein